ncbi:MAG: tRNA (adenosine(37)-N6)-threonylcarbamoyltransferase complex ATPase subunit type 1 TsaE, partial [Deltaproteobacteria bacterium]|nr:tRNA (adenosine(37)-N6)-threonylcarbamoyltransferase complex ATPase subunit type 1 TsaE [Deltaproteobacteria bacterium]
IGEVGLVIALIGPLVAGKTLFVKGLAEGLGVDPRLVSSPTFVIAQQYPLDDGVRVLHHVDLYRLESELELEAIGFDEMFARGAVLAVEWADRFPGALGAEGLEIELEGPSASAAGDAGALEATTPHRAGRVRARGPEAERVLTDWSGRVARWLAEDEEGVSTARPSKGRPGQADLRSLAPLLLALGLAGLAGFDASEAPEVCGMPSVVAEDALGVRSVACGSDREGLPARAGVGGLLFGRRVDLNAASAPLLEALPGIGPARAQAIVASRAERPFVSVTELERVPGIGPGIRARVEPWLRVQGAIDAQSALHE